MATTPSTAALLLLTALLLLLRPATCFDDLPRTRARPSSGGHPYSGSRVEVFLGIAVPYSSQSVLKAFNRTVANVSATLAMGEYGNAYRNVSLQPFFVELPENGR